MQSNHDLVGKARALRKRWRRAYYSYLRTGTEPRQFNDLTLAILDLLPVFQRRGLLARFPVMGHDFFSVCENWLSKERRSLARQYQEPLCYGPALEDV